MTPQGDTPAEIRRSMRVKLFCVASSQRQVLAVKGPRSFQQRIVPRSVL